MSAEAMARMIWMRVDEYETEQLLIAFSYTWKVRYLAKAISTASVCRFDRM
jgi:hypothetical protein